MHVQKNSRKESGFTLMFAVILSVAFATLLFAVLYFLKLNTKESSKGIFKLQTIYLAESGNNRALSQLNIMSLPEVDLDDLDIDDDELDEFFGDEEDFFDDDDDLDDFFDDEDFDDEDFDFDDDEERLFLAKIPRYINFYHENPFFVNIDTGGIITEGQYYALVSEQQRRIQENKAQGIEQQQELLIQELYFPLPEVNVKKIGTIPVEKGLHLKPGFTRVLAEKVPIKLKQKSIVDEYYNYVPEFESVIPRAKLYAISPNYARPGEYLDIYLDGENLDGVQATFSSSDIGVVESTSGLVSIGISEKAKIGRYRMKIGPNSSEFYIVPEERVEIAAPGISDIVLPVPREGNPQFIKMFDKEKIEGIKIKGENFSLMGQKPIIVPDAKGIIVDVVSVKNNEITVNIETKKVPEGSHYLTIYTEGGQSNSWIFNIEKGVGIDLDDPFTGTYSTLLTLLEVKSLSNLPLKSFIEGTPSGRPSEGGGEGGSGGGGRPSGNEADAAASAIKRNFDLLRSDLDTVWKIETIATVNKISYKETKIIRRSAPRADAAITTNTKISFGQSGIVIKGMEEALTRLEEPSSAGDIKIFVEGEDPDKKLFESREDTDRPPAAPTGNAVVEDLGFGTVDQSPSAKGFRPGGIVAITSLNRSNSYTDFGFVKSTGPNTITIEDPGFEEGHFTGDDVTQFVPSIITPEPISERDAQRNLEPPGSFIRLDGKENFEYVFRTRLDKMADWSGARTSSTKVPDDLELDYEGYLGLAIIEGVPSYTGGNALYGQGALIIDTTLGGLNPVGSTVTIGGSTKLPSIFDGLIYIIGNLQINGPVEIAGSIIVNSPQDNATTRISGQGTIVFSPNSVKKAILHLPFSEEPRTRVLEKSKGQQSILKKAGKK